MYPYIDGFEHSDKDVAKHCEKLAEEITNTVTAVLDEIEREVEKKLEHYAHLEHERWSSWQRYVHSKMVEHSNGNGEWVCLPSEFFSRWERQINTPYKDLTEPEKESDREQVRPYIAEIKAIIKNKRTEI